MPRPRIVNDEQRTRLLRIAIIRRMLPSNKQLARDCGVSERTIELIMTRMVRDANDAASFELHMLRELIGFGDVSRETLHANIVRIGINAYQSPPCRLQRAYPETLTDGPRKTPK